MSGKKIGIAVVGVTAVIAAWYFYTKSIEGQSVPQTVSGPQKPVLIATPATGALPIGNQVSQTIAPPKSTVPRQIQPLPKENVPLVDIFEGLQKSIAAGDVSASCRLAFELDRCGEAEDIAKASSNLDIAIAKLAPTAPGYTSRLAQAKSLKERAANGTKACAGFPIAKTLDAWQYALMAAQSGHVPSMVRYVRRYGNGLDSSDPVATAEGWVAFKQLAPSLLQNAIDQGSPEAIEFAAFMHLKENAKWRLVPYDPVKGIAFYEALKFYAAAPYVETLDRNIHHYMEARKLTPQDMVAARQQSSELIAKLGKTVKGSVDFSGGVPMGEGGDHCKVN